MQERRGLLPAEKVDALITCIDGLSPSKCIKLKCALQGLRDAAGYYADQIAPPGELTLIPNTDR